MHIFKHVANDDRRSPSCSIISFPTCRQSGETWHLLVGNESVARIIPNKDDLGLFGPIDADIWLTIIEDYPDYGWHAVDFADLEHAKALLMTWWVQYASRGAPPETRFECPPCP
jgi:hypothetical protein